jgi:hypothetical protein
MESVQPNTMVFAFRVFWVFFTRDYITHDHCCTCMICTCCTCMICTCSPCFQNVHCAHNDATDLFLSLEPSVLIKRKHIFWGVKSIRCLESFKSASFILIGRTKSYPIRFEKKKIMPVNIVAAHVGSLFLALPELKSSSLKMNFFPLRPPKYKSLQSSLW